MIDLQRMETTDEQAAKWAAEADRLLWETMGGPYSVVCVLLRDRTRALAEIERLKTAVTEWGDAAHRQAAEVARLAEALRNAPTPSQEGTYYCAWYHGECKPALDRLTAERAPVPPLPGKPEAFNPYARIAELEARNTELEIVLQEALVSLTSNNIGRVFTVIRTALALSDPSEMTGNS